MTTTAFINIRHGDLVRLTQTVFCAPYSLWSEVLKAGMVGVVREIVEVDGERRAYIEFDLHPGPRFLLPLDALSVEGRG